MQSNINNKINTDLKKDQKECAGGVCDKSKYCATNEKAQDCAGGVCDKSKVCATADKTKECAGGVCDKSKVCATADKTKECAGGVCDKSKVCADKTKECAGGVCDKSKVCADKTKECAGGVCDKSKDWNANKEGLTGAWTADKSKLARTEDEMRRDRQVEDRDRDLHERKINPNEPLNRQIEEKVEREDRERREREGLNRPEKNMAYNAHAPKMNEKIDHTSEKIRNDDSLKRSEEEARRDEEERINERAKFSAPDQRENIPSSKLNDKAEIRATEKLHSEKAYNQDKLTRL